MTMVEPTAYLHLELLVFMQKVDLPREISPGAVFVEVRLDGFGKACPHFMPSPLSTLVGQRKVLQYIRQLVMAAVNVTSNTCLT
jgi:hypothetical protein